MIAIILKGWPRLSETFIARELEALEARGLTLALWSLRHPTDTKTHPVHGRVRAPVTYLPEYLHNEPARVFRAWRKLRWTPGYRAAKALFNADWKRDRTRNRIRRFGQALVLAAELPKDIRALYAHFIHTPGSVARYTAALTGLPFGVSAHARDIWTTPDWDLAAKLAEARFATTCTADGHARLAALSPGKPPHLGRHGLDLAAWPEAAPRPPRDGMDPADPVTILSVGRAVEKKGYPTLLTALSELPPGLHWRFAHIGGGPLRESLKKQAETLGISARITWRGSLSEDDVRAALQAADLFALTPEIAADGDRDGLPNVLVEAQSQSLAVVATPTGGVTELITSGTNGLIAPAGDAGAIAAALAALITDPARRIAMGKAGRARVTSDFSASPTADAIAKMLQDMAAA
ncbi:MAG: glycosyltransferase family 4 protein [Micropepsaceae bacterium]